MQIWARAKEVRSVIHEPSAHRGLWGVGWSSVEARIRAATEAHRPELGRAAYFTKQISFHVGTVTEGPRWARRCAHHVLSVRNPLYAIESYLLAIGSLAQPRPLARASLATLDSHAIDAFVQAGLYCVRDPEWRQEHWRAGRGGAAPSLSFRARHLNHPWNTLPLRLRESVDLGVRLGWSKLGQHAAHLQSLQRRVVVVDFTPLRFVNGGSIDPLLSLLRLTPLAEWRDTPIDLGDWKRRPEVDAFFSGTIGRQEVSPPKRRPLPVEGLPPSIHAQVQTALDIHVRLVRAAARTGTLFPDLSTVRHLLPRMARVDPVSSHVYQQLLVERGDSVPRLPSTARSYLRDYPKTVAMLDNALGRP